MKKEQKKADAKIRLTTAHKNEQTLEKAKILHDGVMNDKKTIKDNRALERVKLENDSEELRNRVLDVKPEPVAQVTVPMDSSTDISDKPKSSLTKKTKAEILAMLGDDDE